MKKSILAVILGLVAGAVATGLAEALGHLLYRVTPPSDPAALRAFVMALPLRVFIFLLAAWALGALLGPAVATHLAHAKQGYIVATMLLAGAVISLFSIPSPAWFDVAGVLLYPIFGALGVRLGCAIKRPMHAVEMHPS